MDHPSVLLNVLQRSLDRIQQRKQRLVEKIFSWSQTIKYRLHANVSAQRIDGFSSGHQCNFRYRATPRPSDASATTPGGVGTGGEGEDEEPVGDDVSDAGRVQRSVGAEASCFYYQRLCNSRTSAALGSASALQLTKTRRANRCHASSAASSTSPWTGPVATLSTSRQQHHAASASTPLSALSTTRNSSDLPLWASDARLGSLDMRVTGASVAATLKAWTATAEMAVKAQGDLGEGGGSKGAENVSDVAEFQYGEVLEELEGEVSGWDDHADDECGTNALHAHYIDGMYELEPESSFDVLRAQGGAVDRPAAEVLSVYADGAASVQGAGSAGAGGGDARRGAADRLRLPGTAARRNCLLRQSPPVLLFPLRQGSRPYLSPQTLLRLLYLSFPDPRGQLPPHEHARRMQLRWGCTPAANASAVEGVGEEALRRTGGAGATDDGGGYGGNAGRGPDGAWTVAEGEGQPRSNVARSGPHPHSGSDDSSADFGGVPSSASAAASLTPRLTSSTYRVVSVIDNPFSRIGVEHLHYSFMINGPSSPASVVQLLVEESRRASTPGELETRTQRELVYRLQRQRWMEARAAATSAAAAAAASGDGEGGDDDGAQNIGDADTGGAAEAEARPRRREATSSSSHKHTKHTASTLGGHDAPRCTAESCGPDDRLLRRHQPPLSSRLRNVAEADEYFFEHDVSFRLDPDRFIESAPLTLHFFLRTPTHVVEEELIQPLRRQVKALRYRLLDRIVREAYRYGRCEIGGNRFMQLLAHGGSAVLASGTRLSTLTKKKAPSPGAGRWLGDDVDGNTGSSTSGEAPDDDEASSVPSRYTDDDKQLLHSLRGSAALSVWRYAANFQRQSLHTLRASSAGNSAPVSNPSPSDDKTRDHVLLPHDLVSIVELLHQPYDAFHGIPPQHGQSALSSASPGLSASLMTDADDTAPASTSGAGGGVRAGEENVDDDDDEFGVGMPSFLPQLLGWVHRAMGLDMSRGRSAAGRRTSRQHRLLRERLSLLQVAVRELLRRSGPRLTESFVNLISVEPEAAQLVETLSTRPSEFATSATTAPTDSSTSSSPQPPECLEQYNVTFLAVAYLFFNGTAEAYFRAHPLNRRRMQSLQRLDEAVRLSRKARLILLEATEEDYRVHYVDTIVHDATRRFCTFPRLCEPHESSQSFPA
ncbi:hypothetical protein JIQ42_07757 [Leishmania sp. Namibia]|uniref:hypothetical protein n=1 Tax=Leishmania sp. Namibia TaxID=2802991 RepID=UPI001B541168|nr:hypothetical protein JIQ42_07757 [Leishmania sp. Namibia]